MCVFLLLDGHVYMICMYRRVYLLNMQNSNAVKCVCVSRINKILRLIYVAYIYVVYTHTGTYTYHAYTHIIILRY